MNNQRKEERECTCECHGALSMMKKCSMCAHHHIPQEKEDWKERFYKKCCLNGLYGHDGIAYYSEEENVKSFISQERASVREDVLREAVEEAWLYIVKATRKESWSKEELIKALSKLKK